MSESAWPLLDRIGIVCGILAFIGSAYSAGMWVRHHLRERKLREPVPVRILCAENGHRYELPFQPPRRIVTRAEILGLLGMIPSRQQRFDWAWLHDEQFMRHLEEVHMGQRQVLEIPVTAEEFAQLDLGNV